MKFADRSIKWAVIVAVFTVVLVMAGYFAAVVFQGKTDAGQVNAENVNAGNEDDKIPDEIKNEILSEADSQSIISKIEETGLTVGKAYSAKLVEEGSVNILIIGEDKTSYLYDTLGIVSISREKGTMRFIMIPRDTYIEYNEDIKSALQKAKLIKTPGIFKINYSHHIGTLIKYKGKYPSQSISFLTDVIKEKFGVETDDYVRVNTEGFVMLVDLFGGIDINVPYAMNYDDPTQDLSIHLEKGMQHLDGRQAEGFVRFRQGWKEDGTELQIGDTERKENQINFLKAFVKQYGTVKNISKIPEMLNIMGKNIKSSVGAGDVLTKYIGLAKDIILDKYEIESVNLEGKQIRINGSAYVDIQ